MIDGLSPEQRAWLRDFFASPNELTWESLLDGSAPTEAIEAVQSWLTEFADPDKRVPLVLPFMKSGEVAYWYATTRTREGGLELAAELQAWLGPTYLADFEATPTDASNPNAAAMYRQSGGIVWRFTGNNQLAKICISRRLHDYIGVLRWRPKQIDKPVRPVGSIRADFERALVAKDPTAAERYIVELRETGRLNEENLRYLDVRLSAGLGLWPRIAHDHWLIQTMSDLALPTRILADIIEALYRTYIDPIEATSDVATLLATFETEIGRRYPRIFASRRGIRTPRVVKAFLLFEQLQSRPNREIINELTELLDADDIFRTFRLPHRSEPEPVGDLALEADEAFDEFQYDRAFALYAALPLSKKIFGRLLTCAQLIDTHEARHRLTMLAKSADRSLIDALTPVMRAKLAAITSSDSMPTTELLASSAENAVPRVGHSVPSALDNWMAWAEQLERGEDLAGAERALETAVTNWTRATFKAAVGQCRRFANIIGNLSGDASVVARRAVPQLLESFFSEDEPLDAIHKPIAETLFVIVAMDDGLSSVDLEILGQLLNVLLNFGLSSDEYISIIKDLEDVQDRVRSYANFSWSLDICETLAVSPVESQVGREARLSFFLRILGHAQTFAHRLGPQDLLLVELLAKDFEVHPSSVDALRRVDASGQIHPPPVDLSGKLIGIYTLAEAAGTRAKASLEKIYPGCTVEVNSDLVATDKLRNLARTADLFVFAWKSSSHAAFYCLKEALPTGDPIWATGKGSASIVRAVVENLR